MSIEEKVLLLYERLKPEIKDRFILAMSDELGGCNVADCNKMVEPNVITFYVNKLENTPIENIKEIFTHEIIHCLQSRYMDYKETEAYQRQNKLNFFI